MTVKQKYNKAVKNYFKILRGAYTSSQYTPEDFESVAQRTQYVRIDFQSVTVPDNPTNRDLERLLRKTEKLKEVKRYAKEYHGVVKRATAYKEQQLKRYQEKKAKEALKANRPSKSIKPPQTATISQREVISRNFESAIEELENYLKGAIWAHEKRNDMPELVNSAYNYIENLEEVKQEVNSMTEEQKTVFYRIWSQEGEAPIIEVFGSDDNLAKNLQNVNDWLLTVYRIEAKSIKKKPTQEPQAREKSYIEQLDDIGFFD